MEPPGPHVRRRPAAADLGHLSAAPLRLGALAAAATLALTSSGEAALLAVLLGVAAADVVAGATAGAALLAVALRWGTTSLDAVAGAQAVLGPGAWVGPAAPAGASWCAAAALVLASPPGWPALAFGATAALAVAGPAPGGVLDVLLRLLGVVAGVAATVAAGRRLPRRPAQVGSAALAAAAVALALVS